MKYEETSDEIINSKVKTIELNASTEACDFFVVGIGVTTESHAALEQFFADMPLINNIVVIIIQHFSLKYNSLLHETLSRNKEVKVYQIQNEMKLVPGHIYLNPPGYSVTIKNRQFFIKGQKQNHKVNLTINSFFESLAEDVCEKSIGVILSGSGNDGIIGCKAIKEAGGIVIAQNMMTAEFNGTTNSVISTSICDFILKPSNMLKQILRYTDQSSLISVTADQKSKDEIFNILSQIFYIINDHCSIDFSLYKHTTVLRCIDRRIRICQIPTLELYLSFLKENADEVDNLYNSLLIGVTRFFRDSDAFDVVKNKVIPDIINNKSDNTVVKVWVAGCSTGEEAYSLAIILKEYMDIVGRNINVKIFATDIDSQAIEYASTGVYPDNITDDVSQERLHRFFIKKKDGYHVSKIIREMVIFSNHNLINNPPFHKLDILSCRNLLIYFQPKLQAKVISTFQFALETNGFLFLGSSETTGELRNYFLSVNNKWKIFKKKNTKRRPGIEEIFTISTGRKANESKPTENDFTRLTRNNREMEDIYINLLEQCLPPSVIIDMNGELVQICGDVDKFLKVPRGKAFYAIQKMVPIEISTALGTAIGKIRKEKKTVTYTNIKVDFEHEQININLIAKPLYTKKNGALIFVMFEEIKNNYIQSDDVENFQSLNIFHEHIADIEQELQYTKESLQTSIEEIEISTEELQSANEELLVSNEEMHSTNEELQSVNEELMVVNTQYQYKIQELDDLNNDMTNFLNSTTIGTIFLDSNLCVRKFTPAITKEINLIEQDIGRPISHISHNLLKVDLVKESREVMESLVPVEKEIQSSTSSWYLLKYSPFRTNDDIIKGIVFSLVDITRRKEAEENQLKSKDRYEKLVELSPFAIIIINDGKIIFSNTAGLNLFRENSIDNILGNPINKYLNINELLLINKQIEYNESNNNIVIPIKETIIHSDGSETYVEIISMPFSMEGDNSQLMILRDITYIEEENELRKDNENKKMQLNEAIALDTLKSDFFSNLSHELRTPLAVIMSALQILEFKSNESNGLNYNQMKYFKIMKQNCYRQLRIVNNMIDITKIDSGFYDVKLQNHDIVKVLENITLSVSDYIKNKGIELIFNTDVKEKIISFDQDSIERIMLNLLSNAVKFTQAGGIIRVNIIDKEKTLSISVKDTGIGIPEDKHSIIFDRFRQVEKSLTRSHEGSGIGLSLVKSLVAIHNGDITVQSEYGNGTEFIIEIPVQNVSEDYIDIKEEVKQQGNIEKIQIEFANIYNL